MGWVDCKALGVAVLINRVMAVARVCSCVLEGLLRMTALDLLRKTGATKGVPIFDDELLYGINRRLLLPAQRQFVLQIRLYDACAAAGVKKLRHHPISSIASKVQVEHSTVFNLQLRKRPGTTER